MAVSNGTLPVQTSQPDVIKRHNISDEELSMLCEGRKDMVLEFLWISLGVFIGSIPSALSAMGSYADDKNTTKMPIDDLAQVIFFWGGLLLTIVLGIVAYKRGVRAKSLQATIRNRSQGD